MNAQERVIAAAQRFDELGHVGQSVDPDYCPCEDCKAQTELRESLDALYAGLA